MGRKRQSTEDHYLEKLRQATCETFGRKITRSAECENLSIDIKSSTSLYLSSQTLRRFFGFIKTEFSTSMRTLEALAIYNGFDHWEDFKSKESSDNYRSLTLDQEAKFYEEFYKIEIRKEADVNFHNAARNIAFRILFNPGLLHRLTPYLAKNPVSQVYFFERFPYLDGLCTDYTRSLKVYMRKKGRPAQLYGNSLLFLSAFLSGNHKDLTVFIDKINEHAVDKNMHPFLVARLIGSNIVYNHLHDQPFNDWMSASVKWHHHFSRNSPTGLWQYPFYQHCLAEYLHFAGLYEESLLMLKTLNYKKVRYVVDDGYENALEVNYHVALYHNDPLKMSNWINSPEAFEGINPLFKNYYRLSAHARYIQIAKNKKEKQNAQDTLQGLIKKTGYSFFGKYLS